MPKLTRPQIWAHRGFSHSYPENTMAAFHAALSLGVDGLELDVHLSRDGHLVVIHDEHLDRTTTGTGLVVDHTLAELKQLDAGSKFDARFAGERIPTLDEVLVLVSQSSRPITLNIEIKSGILPYPNLECLAYEAVSRYGLLPRVIFSSFNHFAMRNLKQTYHGSRIGLLYTAGLVDPWRYAQFLEAEALHPLFYSVDKSIIDDAHRAGVAVHAYTIDDVNDMVRLAAYGIDAIITNRPDVMLQARNNHEFW